jgi:hypothetical protein
MKHEDVPDELLDLAWRAELARRSPESGAELIEEYCDFEAHPSMASHREELRPILAAVLPAHERQVREEFVRDLGQRIEREVPDADLSDADKANLLSIALGIRQMFDARGES